MFIAMCIVSDVLKIYERIELKGRKIHNIREEYEITVQTFKNMTRLFTFCLPIVSLSWQ